MQSTYIELGILEISTGKLVFADALFIVYLVLMNRRPSAIDDKKDI